MFDREFFPTPQDVLESIQIDCFGKIVLEPQAGKENIVDYCKSLGAKEVLAIEKNKELQKIVMDKAQLIGEDFFDCISEQISHVDMIIMNPPFSNAEKHIVHAYNIAPEGCEIISLCNWQTISKDYRYRELSSLISKYGVTENLGDCFSQAERKTGVEVGLIRLFKPVLSQEEKFEGFFMDEDEEDQQENGIMQFNEVRALVNRYVGAMKTFDKLQELTNDLTRNTSVIGIEKISFSVSYNEVVTSKEEFSKTLQKRSWAYIFSKMNLSKYVTSGVMEDINRFVETQEKYPFTMKNVYRMFDIIIGTRQQTMNKALEEVIDNFTKHTHENRFGVEGWKTNSGHMLNKKFIINYTVKPAWRAGKVELCYHGREKKLDDLVKVLCNITGGNYDDHETLWKFFNSNEGLERNKWYKWSFFEIKGFNKGTLHIKFQNEKDWYLLNKAYGEIKGFTLSDKYTKKKSTSKPKKEKEVVVTEKSSKLSDQLFQLFTNNIAS
jgi:hypothetical protein